MRRDIWNEAVAASGPVQVARSIATGSSHRQANMVAFAVVALALLEVQLNKVPA
jgi:hypothetical protein